MSYRPSSLLCWSLSSDINYALIRSGFALVSLRLDASKQIRVQYYGAVELAGGFVNSSYWLSVFQRSRFVRKLSAAKPRIASFLIVAFVGEGAVSALAIAASNAFTASSVLPVSKFARP